MLNSFRVFEESVFFDLWTPDSGFRIPDPGSRVLVSGSGFRILAPKSGFRFPGFRVALVKDPQQLNPALVVANFVVLFVSTDQMDRKAICIVSYPVYYHHSYPAARISESITCFLPCPTRSVSRLILRGICAGYLQVCPLFRLFTYC